MIIEEKDFRLTSINESSPKFDLELLHIVKPKGGEPREEFKVSGYGLPLDSAMRRIVQYRISKKCSEDAITMKEYLDLYKTYLEEIKKICLTD